MMKVQEFYADVLKGDFTRIKERSPNFHAFVLQCARQDERRDVVDALMKYDFSEKCSPNIDWFAVGIATLVFGVVFVGIKRIVCD